MRPAPEQKDYLQRGQMPVFIPNYYRGAFHQFPEVAGRSSHLLNTGTVSWFYRILIEGLFGVKGCREGLQLDPQLPAEWNGAKIKRRFRGSVFEIEYVRNEDIAEMTVHVDDDLIEGNIIREFKENEHYKINVILPG
jgi:cellobionic acid phosphorylase